MRPKRLIAINKTGAGFEIHADLPETVNAVEFTMKVGEQPIVQPTDAKYVSKQWTEEVEMNLKGLTIGFAPWIQFAPEKWNKMLEEVFTEMVDLWNEKYSTKEEEE